MLKSIIAAGLLTVAIGAQAAAPAITLGDPKMNGTGCTNDNSSVSLTDDKTQLSILFSEYNVESKGATTTQRKTCNISVPVKVPPGLSVSIIQVDYRGYNFLPRGAKSEMNVEYFFADKRGPSAAYKFPDLRREDGTPDRNGVLDREFFVRNELQATAVNWSPCGKDVILRVNSAIKVNTNAKGDLSTASVDSADISTKTPIIYKLTWKECRE